jgi:hypothetical protein
LGHHNVEENQIKRPIAHHFQSLKPVFSNTHRVALTLKSASQQIAVHLIVVNYQHAALVAFHKQVR